MTTRIRLRIFTVISIILLCIALTTKPLQNDTFYMIKLGEDISKNGIDLVDHYSWVAALSYTYPHWLYDIFIYWVYNNFNYLGVYISNMILFIVLVSSIYIINLKTNRNELMASIISIVSIPCLVGFVTARAQLITGILFLWQVYFIEKLIGSGKKSYVLVLALISLLVANLHATIWLFYFILYLPFIGEHLVYKILQLRKKKAEKSSKLIIEEVKNFKLLVLSAVIGFFMGFLSPSKICFTYIFRVMMGNSQNYILEHAPMVLISNIPFLIFILLVLVVLIFSNTKIKLKELFMIGGLIFMSLSSGRHSFFFYIIGLLYISILCSRYLIEKNDITLEVLTNLFVKNKIIYVIGIILVCVVSFIKFQDNYSLEYVPEEDYPIEAVNYIKDNLDINTIHLYNDYNFGSYLLFNDIPVFIDSRCDLYLKEFNGLDYSIFDDAMNIKSDYEEKFDFYGVTHALVFNTSILNKLFEKDSSFNIIYSDKYFSLIEIIN